MTKKIIFILFLLTLSIPNFVYADAGGSGATLEMNQADQEALNRQPQKPKTPPSVRLVNPIGGKYNEDYTKQTDADSQGNKDIQKIIGNAIQVTLRLLGAITLGIFFYGGFMWLTSAGNSEKVSTGTKTMMYATLGLFIIFGAYGILTTVISGITSGKAVGGGGSIGGTSQPANPNCDAQCQKELDCANKNNECLADGGDYETCLEELRQCTR